jgi:hypothetical protein
VDGDRGGFPRSIATIRGNDRTRQCPLERNYGLELSITHAPQRASDIIIATTFQRAYLSQLPASFFSSVSSLLNGKQLDGATSIPYTQAYGEPNYRSRSGLQGAPRELHRLEQLAERSGVHGLLVNVALRLETGTWSAALDRESDQ